MSGFGTMPFGAQPFGLGTAAFTAPNTGTLLPDVNGIGQGSRYIDTRLRQYIYGANGNSSGMTNVAQLVLMAVTTVAGSSAQASLGLAFPSGVIGPNFVQQQTAKIVSALSAIVTAGLISIVEVKIDVTNLPVFTRVRWIDLTTSQEQETTA